MEAASAPGAADDRPANQPDVLAAPFTKESGDNADDAVQDKDADLGADSVAPVDVEGAAPYPTEPALARVVSDAVVQHKIEGNEQMRRDVELRRAETRILLAHLGRMRQDNRKHLARALELTSEMDQYASDVQGALSRSHGAPTVEQLRAQVEVARKEIGNVGKMVAIVQRQRWQQRRQAGRYAMDKYEAREALLQERQAQSGDLSRRVQLLEMEVRQREKTLGALKARAPDEELFAVQKRIRAGKAMLLARTTRFQKLIDRDRANQAELERLRVESASLQYLITANYLDDPFDHEPDRPIAAAAAAAAAATSS